MSRDDRVLIATSRSPEEILAIFLGDDTVLSKETNEDGEIHIETENLPLTVCEAEPHIIEFAMEHYNIQPTVEIIIFLDKFAGYDNQIPLIMEQVLRLLKQIPDDLFYDADSVSKLVRQDGQLRVLRTAWWDHDYSKYIDVPF